MTLPPALVTPISAAPLWLVERVARTIFAGVLRAHPDLFERLGEYRQMRYCFTPFDLPWNFLVVPATRTLNVSRKAQKPASDACIEGPLVLLLGLLEGRCDADALFFSRDLSVTGDMEAMLALRNALDDSAIDLPDELAALAGPLAPFVKGTARYIRKQALEGKAASWN